MLSKPSESRKPRLLLLLIPLAIAGALVTKEVVSEDRGRHGSLPVNFALPGAALPPAEIKKLKAARDQQVALSGRWRGSTETFTVTLDFDQKSPWLTISPLDAVDDYQAKDISAALTRTGRLLEVSGVQCLKYGRAKTWVLLHSGCPSLQVSDQFSLSRVGKYELKLKYRLGELTLQRE